MTILVRDAGHERCKVVVRRAERLDDDPSLLLADIDRLIKAHMRGFQHRSRNPHGSAVPPLLHHALHRSPLIATMYLPSRYIVRKIIRPTGCVLRHPTFGLGDGLDGLRRSAKPPLAIRLRRLLRGLSRQPDPRC
jgi:hypothetical protein